MTIAEAYDAISAVTPPDRSISIQVELWWFAVEGDTRREPKVEYLVYIAGRSQLRAPTLDEAVERCLIAARETVGDVVEVEAVFAEVSKI